MVPLENEQVQQLTKISVERAIIFLQSGKVEDSEDFQ
jgi:hypothetical protein